MSTRSEPIRERRPTQTIAVLWDQFSPYHMDRCRRLAADLGEGFNVLGVQICPRSDLYGWAAALESDGFELVTLFPDGVVEAVKPIHTYKACCRLILKRGINHLFIPGYHRAEFLAIAASARLLSKRCYLMIESKFEDQPRRPLREMGKGLAASLFEGALAGGPLTRSYLDFLGFKKPVEFGYDTVSATRVRANAARSPVTWAQRAFLVVARLVHKKNLAMLLAAFARYQALAGDRARKLRLCGSGPLEAELKEQAEQLGIQDRVSFLGFQQERVIATELRDAICLLLPSTEEQWGLVVNEAVFMGLPVIVSDRVGARDTLVRSMVNGFVMEPDNVEGWARAMSYIASNEETWRRFSQNSLAVASSGDTGHFSLGARRLMNLG